MEERPYRSLNEYYRSIFGRKAAKISLDGGFTCPNRDGTCGTRGCLFCSAGGSGDFAENAALSITEQIAKGKAQTAGKWKNPAYIAYFQAFTNTYAPVEKLRQKYEEALACPEIEGISIATRADCLPADVLSLLAELNKKTNLWVELGLQTADAQSAAFIRRGSACSHRRSMPSQNAIFPLWCISFSDFPVKAEKPFSGRLIISTACPFRA